MTDDPVYLRALSLTTFIIPTFNARLLMLCGVKPVLCGLCKMVSLSVTAVGTVKHDGHYHYHILQHSKSLLLACRAYSVWCCHSTTRTSINSSNRLIFAWEMHPVFCEELSAIQDDSAENANNLGGGSIGRCETNSFRIRHIFLLTFFYHNAGYCRLPKYWPFLLNHPMYCNRSEPVVQVSDQASERWEDKLLDLAIIFFYFLGKASPLCFKYICK